MWLLVSSSSLLLKYLIEYVIEILVYLSVNSAIQKFIDENVETLWFLGPRFKLRCLLTTEIR